MKRDEQISYLVICALMLLVIFWVIPTQIVTPPNAFEATVSPRLIPQICAWSIFVLSAYKFVSTLHLAEAGVIIQREGYRLLGIGLVIIIAGTLVMQGIRAAGLRQFAFWVGATLITAGSMWMTGVRNWRNIALFSVGLSVATYFLLILGNIYIR